MISWRFKTQNQQPIGLDIGHNSIKMNQLAMNRGQIRVLAANQVYIDPAAIDGDTEQRTGFVISAIKQMLAEGDFRGRNVVSCLPNEELKITSLRLAETDSGEIEPALRKEAAQRFGLDQDKDIINYTFAGNVGYGDETRNEWILFAADNEAIKSHIKMLEQAELIPVAIDPIPCALFRSFDMSLRRQEDREHTVVFVDLGSRFTTVVFGRDGEISFTKQIPIGGEKFNREIAAKLGISAGEAAILRGTLQRQKSINAENVPWAPGHSSMPRSSIDASTQQVMADAIGAVAEELAREISLCFRYYTVTFRGRRVERAVFTGGEAYENVLLNVLRQQLTVEIELSQPLKGFDITNVNFDSDRRGLLCEWAVAVGLSLKGWEQADGGNVCPAAIPQTVS